MLMLDLVFCGGMRADPEFLRLWYPVADGLDACLELLERHDIAWVPLLEDAEEENEPERDEEEEDEEEEWIDLDEAEPGSETTDAAPVIEQLERLTALRDRGALTDEEFEAQKVRVLSQ
jgi:Short C-terminal domain